MPRLWLILLAIASSTTQADASNPYASLDWVPREQLPQAHQNRLPSFCSGDYLSTPITPKNGKALHVQADQADFHESQGATFSGDVLLEQVDRRIKATSATYNSNTGESAFTGDIQFKADGITMIGERLDYNGNTGVARLENAEYALTPIHLRGSAERLTIESRGVAQLDNATYTFCEPGHNDWDIRASEMILDQNSGFGEAYHTRLRIKEIPIFYIPYYRFPITDQRMTGFLDPTIGLSVEQFDVDKFDANINEIATPFYINIAPNYDDTVTPRFVRDHGVMTENEFRYLNILGEGKIYLTYLDNDLSSDQSGDNQRESERWSKSIQHEGRFSQYWVDRITYDEVSDLDYTDDFKQSGLINRDSHLKQNAELEYDDGNWNFLTRVESYQTIDETVEGKDKPFRRLPQIQFNKQSSLESNDLNYEFISELTRFTRTNNQLTGVDKINGNRAHGAVAASYPFETSWSFLTPAVEVMHTDYQLNNLDDIAIASGYDEDISRDINIFSLDSGLYLERSTSFFGNSFIQTLEPQAMYAYIPYVDQSTIPIFDTTETTFSYDQLFKPNRFTGLDRVGDTNQLALGLTTRFINDVGFEVLKASLGQITYFADRRTSLTPGVTEATDVNRKKNSAFAGELEWRFSKDWRLSGDVLYNPHVKATTLADRQAGLSEERIEKASAQLNYQNEHNWIFDVNLTHVEDTHQKQLGVAFFAPINDSWAIYGQQKRDIWPYRSREIRESYDDENRYIIEGLGGIEYQNCCWRVQLSYEEHTRSDETKDYQFMMQFHLKGLGIVGRNSDAVLGERINGYDQRQIHDY